MSIAWPKKTAEGLGGSGDRQTNDPYTGFAVRRTRVAESGVRVCKTLIRGFCDASRAGAEWRIPLSLPGQGS